MDYVGFFLLSLFYVYIKKIYISRINLLPGCWDILAWDVPGFQNTLPIRGCLAWLLGLPNYHSYGYTVHTLYWS